MKRKWKLLSHVQFFVIPWTGACLAPLSMEFSRPEYWSGLPFPSPGNLPDLGIKPRSSTLQADSLLSEPPGKPMNTGVGSLSLLRGIFPTQELSWGLLHCRQILYRLSHQGSWDHMVGLFSIFWDSSVLFSTVAVPVYIPSTRQKISLFSTCLPAFVILAFW